MVLQLIAVELPRSSDVKYIDVDWTELTVSLVSTDDVELETGTEDPNVGVQAWSMQDEGSEYDSVVRLEESE